ncbi:flagellar basal body P-ring formation chaperone FlgA [Microbulbifer sp. ANSA003]|uniref:flagellar basal body P-ring formation chaperone FlgA n=1 Tax=unclassified Microbulbifer TaxID=2619833 RepID=UPI004039F766
MRAWTVYIPIFIVLLFVHSAHSEQKYLRLYPSAVLGKNGIALEDLGKTNTSLLKNQVLFIPQYLKLNQSISGFWLRKSDISELLVQQYPEHSFSILGPDVIKVKCQMTVFNEKELQEKIKSVYKEELLESKEFSVKILQRAENLNVCNSFDKYHLSRSVKGELRKIEAITISSLGHLKQPSITTVWVEVEDYRDVLTAAENIEQGTHSSSIRVKNSLVDVTKVKGVTIKEVPADTRLQRNIGIGQVLVKDNFESIPDIESGDTVRVISIVNQVKVFTTGTAMSDANLGEYVSIKVDYGQSYLEGKVENNKTVIIMEET